MTHSIYTFVDTRNPSRSRVWTSLPESWRDRYLDQNYHRTDPYYRYCCATFAPIRTGPDYLDDYDFLSEQERKVVQEGGETGFVGLLRASTAARRHHVRRLELRFHA
jgi:hypothetical protein